MTATTALPVPPALAAARKAMADRQKTTDLLSSLKDGDPLFVVNTSDSPGPGGAVRFRGAINIEIVDNGERKNVQVPDTWLPIDLSTYASAKLIAATPGFRRFLGLNMLKILTMEEAYAIFGNAGAEAEQHRLNLKGAAIDSMLAAPTVAPSAPAETPVDANGHDLESMGAEILSRFSAGAINEETCGKQLKALAPTLELAELKRLITLRLPASLVTILHEAITAKEGQ